MSEEILPTGLSGGWTGLSGGAISAQLIFFFSGIPLHVCTLGFLPSLLNLHPLYLDMYKALRGNNHVPSTNIWRRKRIEFTFVYLKYMLRVSLDKGTLDIVMFVGCSASLPQYEFGTHLEG